MKIKKLKTMREKLIALSTQNVITNITDYLELNRKFAYAFMIFAPVFTVTIFLILYYIIYA